MKRIFLIVLDSFGVGGACDAHDFGDAGTDTFKSVCTSKYLNIPNLLKMGLGNLTNFLPHEENPIASYGRLEEISKGKDTTTGHWEMAGVVSEHPFPTYPAGFPEELLSEFSKKCGRGYLLNAPSSGITAIEEYGDEHVKTGDLIIYTSVDSVLQIAAHEEVVPLDELYRICSIARETFAGKHGVGRVIARPFVGTSGNYKRTANRRDFSLVPPRDTILDAVSKSMDVISVGKIADIFAQRGVTESYLTHSNLEGIRKTIELTERDFTGLCFVNLVDFDMLYGHRRDIDGYAKALNEFDMYLPKIMSNLTQDDMLMITADHGCDPAFTKTTDHTRENVPIIIYSPALKVIDLGKRKNFAQIAATIRDALNISYDCSEEGFYGKLI
ncbi:MAG: phosphopentomutase [Clostridia bacterium]|nr:phosphopentomutase [Clostridia bacterium]